MPVRIIICKSRRAGLSTGVSALIYDDTVTHPNTMSLIVANERNPSENVLGMYTRFWKHTPEKINFGGYEIKVRPDLPAQFNNNPPKDRLELADPIGSKIFVASARSLDAYLSFGFQNIHATEASRFADGHELFRALYPTLSRDAHSALYVESTPNGQSGAGAWFYEQCMDAQSRRDTQYGEMRLVFIPWHEMKHSFAFPFADVSKRDAFVRSYTSAERDLLKRFPFIMPEQFLWRRTMLAGPPFNRDEDIFMQEYPEDLATAFLMTGSSVFGRKAIRKLMASSVREPIWEGDVYFGESSGANRDYAVHTLVRSPHFLTHGQALARGFESNVIEGTFANLRVWRWPNKGEKIVLACDVGGGNPETRDGDFSTVCVGVLNDFEKDELIMTWEGRIGPVAFGELASALAWGVRYQVGDAVVAPLLAPEWNGPGTAMCSYIDSKGLYPNLYRYQPPGVHGMPKSKHIGWESNAKTKRLAINFMLRMVERDLIDIPDERLVLQMSSYRQLDSFNDEGSFGGASGVHDDLVSAFQILCALLRIESVPVPGALESMEVYESLDDGNELPPFDPFASTMSGLRAQPATLEQYEETLFWSP